MGLLLSTLIVAACMVGGAYNGYIWANAGRVETVDTNVVLRCLLGAGIMGLAAAVVVC